jgi:hypothetical protein
MRAITELRGSGCEKSKSIYTICVINIERLKALIKARREWEYEGK